MLKRGDEGIYNQFDYDDYDELTSGSSNELGMSNEAGSNNE